MTLTGRDIVCVGFADWETDLRTNQHHLMSRLAATNRVLFIESLGLRRPQLVGRDVRRIARRVLRGLRGARAIDDLHVLSPLVVPRHDRLWAQRINGWLLPRLVGASARRLGLHAPILWGYVPQAQALIDVLSPSLVVYHCVDDIAATKGIDAESFRSAERSFAGRADLVLASSRPLAERMRELSDHVLEVPNVADTRRFATALESGPVDEGMQALSRPTIVFTGAVVATKLDVALLVELAGRRPGWSFALVGPVGVGDPRTDVSALAHLPNVHLLGARPYHALPAVLRGADAAVIPYAVNQLTASIFPMKVYEYLAAGLGVVATPLPSLAEVEGIETAADAGAMAACLTALIDEDSPERRAQRSRLAAGHSWDARLEEIGQAVDAVEPTRR
ncbi:MAG: glycosyltransferase [Actinomycetota bacterium]|nr:glycosyltransferase [Actinomycetota bacterium]